MFSLTKDQGEKLKVFLNEQLKKRSNFGAIGGETTYEFTPTNLGTIVIVTFCKGTDYEATIDLTDYGDW